MNAHNFVSIAIFVGLIGLTAWFLHRGKLSGKAFIWSLLACPLAVAVIHNLDVVQKLSFKGASLEATAEFKTIRNDVYAKADQVQKMTEAVAGMLAESTANEGRFGGTPDKANQEFRILTQLKEVLRNSGASTEKVKELLQPLEEALPSDYRSEIFASVSEIDAQKAVTLDVSNYHQKELEKALRTRPPLSGLDHAIKLLNDWKMSSTHLTNSLESYKRFLESRETK